MRSLAAVLLPLLMAPTCRAQSATGVEEDSLYVLDGGSVRRIRKDDLRETGRVNLSTEAWPIATPFHELAGRILARTTTPGDRADLRTVVHSLLAGGRGPWRDRVRVAPSADGLDFEELPGTVVEKASVPEAVVDEGGNVWLFYVDADLEALTLAVEEGRPFPTGLVGFGGLAAARSTDGLRFERVELEIEGVVAGEVVDPEILVRPDGTYQLYYLGVPAGRLAPDTPDPARAEGAHDFYLATSRDLVHWEEEGVAWTGPAGGADPTVFGRPEGPHYILGGGTGISEDGGHTFRPLEGVEIGRGWGQPEVVSVEGGFRAFYSTLEGIRSAFSKDGRSWREEGVRLRGGADPTVVRMPDGSWRLYFKVGGAGPVQEPSGRR